MPTATAEPDTALDDLRRDITEALLRLRLARAERDRGAEGIAEARLNALLDRLERP